MSLTAFDPESDRLILISYPAGGFGHFLYHVLTHYCDGTVKISDADFSPSAGSNFHDARRYTQVWSAQQPDRWTAVCSTDFSAQDRILILCDHGRAQACFDSLSQLRDFFPKARIVRVCSHAAAAPVIFNTYNNKTGHCYVEDMREQTRLHWGTDEDWAVRENYTHWYHSAPYQFEPILAPGVINLHLSDLVSAPVTTLVALSRSLDLGQLDLIRLKLFCRRWLRSQHRYFKVFSAYRRIVKSLQQDWYNIDLTHITDLHDQGYLNYCIERDFHVTIPVYDYKNWFSNTEQIKTMIRNTQP